MATKSENTCRAIRMLFDNLSAKEQVALMASLYYTLDDYHKDEFLRETDNA